MASAEQQPESLNIQLLVDSIPALIHTARPDGYLDYFNKPWLEYFGVTLDKVAGWNWTAYIHPEDVEGIVAQWRACLASGEIFEYETRVRRANGEYRWMFHRKVPLRDANGNIVKWYGSSLDIEDRKQTEVLLFAEKRLLEMTATDVTQERILNDLCLFIEEQRCGTLASVLLLNPDGVYLRFAAGPSIPNEWKQQMEKLPIGPCAGSCGTAAFTRLPVIVSDIATDPLWEVPEHRDSALKHGLRASWSSPVISSKGKVLGTFCMYYREPRSPEAQDLELIKSATHLVEVAIERDRAEQALGRSEAYLTEAQRLSRTGSFGWRPDTGEIVWSDETYRIFEYDPAEKPTLNMVFQRIHPHDRALAQQVIDGVSGSTDFEHEYRLVMPSEAIKHIRVRAHAVPDSSGNIEVVGAVTDITQRKTAEDKIRRLIEAGILGIFIADVEDKIVEANQAFLQMLQYDRQDLVSGRLRWTDLTPAELRERDQRALTEALATGVFQPYEKEFLRKDGSRLPVLIGGALFQSANEGVVFVLDLSEQKRAEEGLRQGEQRFRLVLENIGAQVIATTLEGELEFVNQPVLDYFGKTKEQMNGWRTSDVIHPDDLASAIVVWKGSIESGASYDVDHRFRRSDGVYRWFHVVGRPQRDAQGSIVRWYTLLTDIDERKTAEEALRSSEADLLEAQRLSHMGSWRHDVLTGEVTFSPEVHRIFDIRPGEDASTARFFFSRIHPEDRPIEAQKYERANLAKTDFESDYRIVLPDGSIKYVHNLGHLVLNESGDSREFVGTVIDITERKTAEEKIREQETELRQLVDLVPQLIAVYGPNRERLHANRTALDYLGISLDEWRHKSFGASTHPDDSERLKSYTDRALSSGVPDELELRLRKHDGSYRWFLALLNPLRDEHGQVIRWYFTGTDIDDRKHAEDRLRQENVALKRAEEKIRGQEAELRQIMDLAPLLIGVYGPNRERLYANRTALNYHGMSLDEWRHASFADYSHPDDSERLKTFANRVFSSGTPGELELRTRKHDGSYRWFLARFYPLRDEQGQITRWYSTGTDIHDRKQSEDALRRENVALREEIDKASMFEEIVGTSPPLQTVLSLISKVAQSNSTVLITGETGTGKELVARAIHRRSNRASRPFVSVNCAAIPRDLIASELFGHEKGAFTGATQQRLGRFELANGGTLFLDEVGELPAESQIALLRVLQEHEFERVGGTRPIRADVRVIAATNRDLQAAIGTGSFRSDLFYRLNVFPIEIPALRERKEDIRLLLEYFIDRYARNAGKTITTVDKKTLQLLEAYPWPGNIRELQNVIERSVIVCETESFSVDESWLSHQPSERKVENQLYLSEKVAAQEKEMIEAALRECQGRVYGPSGAAAKLGIARSTLESKIRSLKINKNRFRA